MRVTARNRPTIASSAVRFSIMNSFFSVFVYLGGKALSRPEPRRAWGSRRRTGRRARRTKPWAWLLPASHHAPAPARPGSTTLRQALLQLGDEHLPLFWPEIFFNIQKVMDLLFFQLHLEAAD